MQQIERVNIAVVIPALNESATIQHVLQETSEYAIPIVVDDGSTDNTSRIAEQLGAFVVKHSKNLGYDAALQSGLFQAIKMGMTYAVTVDADGQHNPQLIKMFISNLEKGTDLVIGERSYLQRPSEHIFSWVGKLIWKINDPLCGMKGYRLKYLSDLGFFNSYESIGTEFAIRCANKGLKIVNIPIPNVPRQGHSRFGTGFKPNYKIIKALFLGLILKFRSYR